MGIEAARWMELVEKQNQRGYRCCPTNERAVDQMLAVHCSLLAKLAIICASVCHLAGGGRAATRKDEGAITTLE